MRNYKIGRESRMDLTSARVFPRSRGFSNRTYEGSERTQFSQSSVSVRYETALPAIIGYSLLTAPLLGVEGAF